MKAAPFGVTTLNFDISCSRFDLFVLVAAALRRRLIFLFATGGCPPQSRLVSMPSIPEFYGDFVNHPVKGLTLR